MPVGAAQSTPVCMRIRRSKGWRRLPNPAREAATLNGVAHQELLRAGSVLVIEVDRIVRGTEAIELTSLATHRHGGVEHLAGFVAAGAIALEENFERVAGANLLLEVHIVRMDPQQLHDDVGRKFLLKRRLVEALVERGAVRGRNDDFVERCDRGGQIVSVAVARRRHNMLAGFVEDADADRLLDLGVRFGFDETDVNLLAGLQVLRTEQGVETVNELVRQFLACAPRSASRPSACHVLPTVMTFVSALATWVSRKASSSSVSL